MSRQHPRSTPFPSPPLCRPAVAATTEKLGAAAPYVVAPLADLAHLVVEAEAPEALLGPIRARGVRVRVAAAAPRQQQDRKSTRLNSSHANISDALFCF